MHIKNVLSEKIAGEITLSPQPGKTLRKWRNIFKPGPNGGVVCGLALRVHSDFSSELEQHNWITKWDGAENTDIEGVKGGLSGAMKRAGVQWQIGRYLYLLDVSKAIVTDDGKFYAYCKKAEKGFQAFWNEFGVAD